MRVSVRRVRFVVALMMALMLLASLSIVLSGVAAATTGSNGPAITKARNVPISILRRMGGSGRSEGLRTGSVWGSHRPRQW